MFENYPKFLIQIGDLNFSTLFIESKNGMKCDIFADFKTLCSRKSYWKSLLSSFLMYWGYWGY